MGLEMELFPLQNNTTNTNSQTEEGSTHMPTNNRAKTMMPMVVAKVQTPITQEDGTV